MGKFVLDKGEYVAIELGDAEGRFTIEYGEDELTVRSDLPGSHMGAEGLIYREVYNGCTCTDVAQEIRPDKRCPMHGDKTVRWPTFRDVQSALVRVRAERDRSAAMFLMSYIGKAELMSGIDEADYPAVIGACEEYLRITEPTL